MDKGSKKLSKYNRVCKGQEIDVYDVLQSFSVTNPAIAHAVKKLLAGGQRGYKDIEQDYREAIASIKRGIELENEKLQLEKKAMSKNRKMSILMRKMLQNVK